MENRVELLNPNRTPSEPPILSYQCTALVGVKSSGKTTTMLQIYKQFLNNCKTNQYDLLNPFEITHARFTHQIYISPTSQIDLTLQRDPILSSFQFFKTDDIYAVCEGLMQMQIDYIECQKYQNALIMYKYDDSIDPKLQVNYITTCIKYIELMKQMYPTLKQKCNVEVVGDLYRICRMKYDGFLVRRPKVSLILDDIGSEKQVSSNQINNPLFSLIKGQRHYSVYCSFYVAHTLSLLYGQLRDQFNCFVLKRAVNQTHLKDLFNNQLALTSRTYDFKQFDEMYQQWTSEENKRGYNSLYILTLPFTVIYRSDGNNYEQLQ